MADSKLAGKLDDVCKSDNGSPLKLDRTTTRRRNRQVRVLPELRPPVRPKQPGVRPVEARMLLVDRDLPARLLDRANVPAASLPQLLTKVGEQLDRKSVV